MKLLYNITNITASLCLLASIIALAFSKTALFWILVGVTIVLNLILSICDNIKIKRLEKYKSELREVERQLSIDLSTLENNEEQKKD